MSEDGATYQMLTRPETAQGAPGRQTFETSKSAREIDSAQQRLTHDVPSHNFKSQAIVTCLQISSGETLADEKV